MYIDRRVSQAAFITEQLKINPHIPAILEGNGGATFWGDGVTKTAQYITLLEEAARFQTLAEAIGGPKEYGPGVLEQQWKMTGLKAACHDSLLNRRITLTWAARYGRPVF